MEKQLISIRKLHSEDWQTFKTLRLRALDQHAEVFCPSTDEHKRSEAEWRTILSSTDRQVFALFDGERAIGLTGVVTDRDDESGKTALFVMSFIEKDYRGQGLSRLFYEERIAWVQEKGSFQKMVIGHRDGNEASAAAIRKFGFVHSSSRKNCWADGSDDLLLIYERAV